MRFPVSHFPWIYLLKSGEKGTIQENEHDVDLDEWMPRFRLRIRSIHRNFTILYSSLLLIPNSLMYGTPAPTWLQILNYLLGTQSLGHTDTNNQHSEN